MRPSALFRILPDGEKNSDGVGKHAKSTIVALQGFTSSSVKTAKTAKPFNFNVTDLLLITLRSITSKTELILTQYLSFHSQTLLTE